MRTHSSKLWQTLLATLVVSGLACGGSSGGGTGNDGGGHDGGPNAIDVVTPPVDLALPSIDVAAPSVDQATARVDQAVDLGVKLDVGTDVRAADALDARDVQPDLPIQSDLPWGPEVIAKTDLPPATPDLPITQDLPPAKDLPPSKDLPPALDQSVKIDVSPDAFVGLDTTVLDSGIDTDPTAPVVAPNKLTFAPGEAITATYANGSTNEEAWIGIYPVGSADNAYRDWKYTSGATSGTMLLHVPGTAGTYELRMFANGASPYVLLATSVPFTVAQ